MVESAVGAHVANAAVTGDGSAYYWRKRNREVDCIVLAGKKLVALEVKKRACRGRTGRYVRVFRDGSPDAQIARRQRRQRRRNVPVQTR